MQTQHEVAQVLDLLADKVEDIGLNKWQLRTLSAIKICRTAELGGHIDACDSCGNITISYNSCRNRHCPKCQGHKREQWIEKIGRDLLPLPYFHVVFTLPDALNTLVLHRPRLVYDTLFAASWQTINQFGINKEVQMGMISILHTWGQTLGLHPHLHCIVPGGGVDKSGKWHNIRADGQFLFSVKALGKVFRAKFVSILNKSIQLDKTLREKLFEKPWVVYAKRPFGSPKSVVEYLGRYTHKIAISNHRIKSIDKNTVTFGYKDYKYNGEKKVMTLSHKEFVRRFSQHILPKRFVKIRHYGFLSSTWKRLKFKILQEKFNIRPVPKEEKVNLKLNKCPCYKTGNLIMIEVFGKRGPPDQNALGDSQTLVPHKK
jgi:Putative transposase/Transposase zinc-binding domain